MTSGMVPNEPTGVGPEVRERVPTALFDAEASSPIRRRSPGTRALGALFLCLATLLSGWQGAPVWAGGPDVPGLAVGVTHTQYSADSWNPAPAVARATSVLRTVASVQDQALMGWGATNPEPRPGDFQFGSLDERIHMITAMGAEPVLTLCCAPDWMTGGQAGTTDWSRLGKAPTRDHVDDFAALAAAAAKRYPQVRRFVVWNELKGFYDPAHNDWDVAAYTRLYDAVYRAVKRVRPDALVGGPYVVFDLWSSRSAASNPSHLSGPWGVVDQRSVDAVDYWLAHAVGADFIAVDGSTATRDRGLTTTDFEATQALGAITLWLRSRTALPVWWSEIYAPTDDRSASSADPRRAAVMLQALVTVAKAGASGALLWQPQANADLRSAALFTSTVQPSGGRALPLAVGLSAIADQLRQDPRGIVTTWRHATSTWELRTSQWVLTWSVRDGLRGPHAASRG